MNYIFAVVIQDSTQVVPTPSDYFGLMSKYRGKQQYKLYFANIHLGFLIKIWFCQQCNTKIIKIEPALYKNMLK